MLTQQELTYSKATIKTLGNTEICLKLPVNTPEWHQ